MWCGCGTNDKYVYNIETEKEIENKIREMDRIQTMDILRKSKPLKIFG